MERNEVIATGCRSVAVGLFLVVLGILCLVATVSLSAQEFQHVHKGFHLIAEKIPAGSMVEMYVEKDLPEDLVFPLPDGLYNIYIVSPTDSMRATEYLRLAASARNVDIKKGSVINIAGGITKQALILIDTAGILDPVISVQAEASGHAWTMWRQGPWYYAYVDTGYEWSIGDYRFRPNAGEVWKLNEVVINYVPDSIFTPEPEPESDPDPDEPSAPVRIDAANFADQQGVVLEAAVIGYIEPGDWIRYLAEDFTGRTKLAFSFSYGSSTLVGRKMLVRVDSVDGPVIAEWEHESTSSWSSFEERELDITPLTGSHEIFLTFEGDTSSQYHYVMNLAWIELR